MPTSLPNATYQTTLLWLFRRYRRYRVTGPSMLPLLSPGQEVLLDPRAYRHHSPQVGDVVVADHPRQSDLQIIKRVDFVNPDGDCYLKGDNPDGSSDSRQFGLVLSSQLYGKVVCLFP